MINQGTIYDLDEFELRHLYREYVWYEEEIKMNNEENYDKMLEDERKRKQIKMENTVFLEGIVYLYKKSYKIIKNIILSFIFYL